MAFLDYTSSHCLWRGYDYLEAGCVRSCKEIKPGVFQGIVNGTEGRIYSVTIDVAHPYQSTCGCDMAEEKHFVCKHMVALYLYSHLEERKALEEMETDYFMREEEENEETSDGETKEDVEISEENHDLALKQYIEKLDEKSLKQALFEAYREIERMTGYSVIDDGYEE